MGNKDINVNTEVQGEEQAPINTEVQEEKMLPQSKVNEIVESRLKREREKLEKQFSERINVLEENIKLQAMTEQEKANYQAQKELEAFEEERKAFYEERDAFNKEKYRTTIQAQLQEAGLPTTMADMLVNMDAEAVATQINAMKEMFSTQINAQVQSKVQASANVPTQPVEQVKLLSLDEIKAMSSSEYIANKELVEKSLKALSK